MTVYLVGAGPGDPGLVTRRAAELLGRAEVVVHDRLIDPGVLALAPPGAELLDVGKRPGPGSSSRQRDINELLVARGSSGQLVVRLKGGDPFVFGRGGEEAEALAKAGVPFEVVPGVTSAFAVPAAAGVPVTHRGLATSVTVVTGHVGDPTAPGGVDWEGLAKVGGTLVVLMGMATKAEIATRLMAGGLAPDTPVAVVEWGTTAAQRSLRTTLARLFAVELGSPAVVVVGAVAGLSLDSPLEERLSPAAVPKRPLAGLSVVVTRPTEQAGPTLEALAGAGAQVLNLALTEVVGPADGGAALRAAAGRAAAGRYDWVAFTSAQAVGRFLDCVEDLRALAGLGLAVVGGSTGAALARRGLLADFVPSAAQAVRLAEELPEGPAGRRVLFPKAAGARPELPEGLRRRGFVVDEVEAYRTEATAPPPGLLEAAQQADVVTFAAPSAVAAYVELSRSGPGATRSPKLAALGPTTAAELARRGLEASVVAKDPRPGAVVEALVEARRCGALAP